MARTVHVHVHEHVNVHEQRPGLTLGAHVDVVVDVHVDVIGFFICSLLCRAVVIDLTTTFRWG